jgi:hypothetical protein
MKAFARLLKVFALFLKVFALLLVAARLIVLPFAWLSAALWLAVMPRRAGLLDAHWQPLPGLGVPALVAAGLVAVGCLLYVYVATRVSGGWRRWGTYYLLLFGAYLALAWHRVLDHQSVLANLGDSLRVALAVTVMRGAPLALAAVVVVGSVVLPFSAAASAAARAREAA